jgi:hypothetical protein
MLVFYFFVFYFLFYRLINVFCFYYAFGLWSTRELWWGGDMVGCVNTGHMSGNNSRWMLMMA